MAGGDRMIEMGEAGAAASIKVATDRGGLFFKVYILDGAEISADIFGHRFACLRGTMTTSRSAGAFDYVLQSGNLNGAGNVPASILRLKCWRE